MYDLHDVEVTLNYIGLLFIKWYNKLLKKKHREISEQREIDS